MNDVIIAMLTACPFGAFLPSHVHDMSDDFLFIRL